MTLATLCTACGTTFRVVQDQLRVSEGWVRCGRCNEVFSALETLSELPDEEPVVQAVSIEQPAEQVDGPAGADFLRDPPRGWSASQPAAMADEAALAPHADLHAPEPALASSLPALDTAAPVPEWSSSEAGPVDGEDHRLRGATDAPAVAPPAESEVHVEIPAFVREADAQRSAASPRAQRSWVLGSVLAALVLVGQAVHGWRDALATWVPATRPALAVACEWLSCQLSPWRQLDGLSVESSNLGQVGSTTIYQLSVVLRNRTRLELMAPSLDLALTDSQGRTVARRVLSVTDLGAQGGPLPPGGELALQARLSTGDRRITGYALEIFHP